MNKHSYLAVDDDGFSNSCSICGRNREDTIHDYADSKFIYVVFYGGDDFNYLAAFETEEAAKEYASRSVWSHIKTFVSRQPLF